MVTTTGMPSCCGALVFTGFSGDDVAVRASLVECARNANDRMKWSFILNDRQVQALPLTLAEAHRMGFVLSASWANYNHNSQLYEFERCGERMTLNSAAEKIGWVGRVKLPNMGGPVLNDPLCLLENVTRDNTRHIDVAGRAARLPHQVRVGDHVRMVRDNQESDISVGSIMTVREPYAREGLFRVNYITANGRPDTRVVDLAGTERVEYTGPAGGGGPRWMPNRNQIGAGSRVRVESPQSRYNGQEHVIDHIVHGGWDRNDVAVMLAEGDVRVAVNRLRLVAPAEEPQWVALYRTVEWRQPEPEGAAPAFQPPFQEINLVDGEEQWRAERPGAVREVVREVPAAVVRASIATVYCARYRDGRIGAAHPSIEAVRAAAPRVLQYVRRDYFNTVPHVVDQNPQDMPR